MTSSAKERNSKRTRVQIDCTPTHLARLERVIEKAEVPTRTAAIMNALLLYEWFLDEKIEGNKIQLVTADGETKDVVVLI